MTGARRGASARAVERASTLLLSLPLSIAIGVGTSHAQSEASEATETTGTVDTGGSASRREVPNYDGRDEPPLTLDEGLLFVPRVLFFPVHLVFEYVLRRPALAIIGFAEREQLPVRTVDFFTWNERGAGIIPLAFYDFGLLPNVGFYFFWNDFGVDGNRIRVHAATGGTDYVRLAISDTYAFDDHTELTIQGEGERRPDQVFQGLGWDTYIVDRARFIETHFDGRVRLSVRPYRLSEVRLEASVSDVAFDPHGYALGSNDPTLANELDNGRLIEPPGFDGYLAYRQRLSMRFDTREPEPASGTGVRLAAYGELGFDVRRMPERRWVRYGGVAQGFVDLWAHRILSLRVEAGLADRLGSDEVPFTEMPTLGGTDLTRFAGFLPNQLIGRSLLVATLQYQYPIWSFLNASLLVSAGNVFGPRYDDFAFDRLRLGVGVAIENVGDADNHFHFAVAVGTAPIIGGASIDSIRFVIGAEPADL